MLNKFVAAIQQFFEATQPVEVSGQTAMWKKVHQLKPGMKIAVATVMKGGNIVEGGQIEFEEIVSIKPIGQEHVFDIEVEGSHNFVGNGILAHNTYITGAIYDSHNEAGTSGQVLSTTATGTDWIDAGSASYWALTSNVLHPKNEYAAVVDLTLGGTSTASATIHGNATTGYLTAQRFVDTAHSGYYLDPAAAGTSLSIDGNIVGNGAFSISTGSDAVAVSIGTTGAGKLDVGTIDPPYTINGEKYATYLAGMTGVKEETAGQVFTNQYVAGKGYRQTIDFTNLQKDSDLWLFSKTANLKEHLSDLVVLLSPAGDARAWYVLDTINHQLHIYSSAPTQISYRLTAPRFDAHQWQNTRSDGSTGFVINNPDEWQLNPHGSIIGELTTAISQIFNQITAQSAQIAQLSVTNLSIGGQTLREYVSGVVAEWAASRTIALAPEATTSGSFTTATVSGTLAANTIQAETLKTKNIQLAPDTTSTASGEIQFATLEIGNASGSAVASINSRGDLSLLGQLTAQNATLLGQLNAATLHTTTLDAQNINAQTASVAGQLTAQSATLLGQLNAQTASVTGELQAEILQATQVETETLATTTLNARSARLEQLEARMAELETIKAQTAEFVNATVSGTLYATKIEGLDDQLATTLNQASFLDKLLGKKSETSSNASLASVFTTLESAGFATDSAQLAWDSFDPNLFQASSDVSLTASAVFINNYFSVNGSGYVAQVLGVGEQLLVGNSLAIGKNFIAHQPLDPDEPQLFSIQPSGKGTLTMMAGLITLHENGQVLIDGDLAIAGKLEVGGTLLANLIEPTAYGESLQIKLANSTAENLALAGEATQAGAVAATMSGQVAGAAVASSRLEILGLTQTPTATISAAGRASFAGGLNIGTQDLTPISTMSATVAATAPSGKATIRSGTLGITIKSPLVTTNSLIYVSPIGSTANQVLYVKAQTAENPATLEQEGGFSVGFDAPISNNTTFNWWIVN